MTACGSALTAGYRADGLRAWKQTSAGRTYYLYDGDQPVEELDGSGNKSAVMTFGPNGVLARTTATRTLLYSFDALGQMAQQIDASTGNIIASYLFDAWGARQVNTGDPTAASDPYSGYNTAAGYITDWETGLQLLGHRYYDPATGRFLNRDPIGMNGGINVYSYAGNSAVSRTDPSGLLPMALAGCLLGAGGGLIGLIFKLIGDVSAGRPISLSPSIQASICSIAAGCLIGLLVFLALLASGLEGEDLILGGCLSGALTSALSGALSMLCEQSFTCKRPNWGCYLATLPVTLIGGCFGGMRVALPASGLGPTAPGGPGGGDAIPNPYGPTVPRIPTVPSPIAGPILGGIGAAARGERTN